MAINKGTLRNTNQRITILNYLKSVKTHPTAETVFNEVKKTLPAITLATVYRNLNLLADQGVILKFEVNKELHFDADKCQHQHLVCKNCNRISDIFMPKISAYALNTIKTKHDADCVQIIFYGTCKECREV